jgi:hypothetical protein
MATRVADWLDQRIGWRSVWETIFVRKVPKVNWFYTHRYPADDLLRPFP